MCFEQLADLTNPVFREPGVTAWHACLDVGHANTGPFASLLSDEERARASRYGNDLLRDRFVVRRGLLRTILGRHLNMRPTDVPLTASPQGKPFVPIPAAPRFSVSSSFGDALFAVCESGEVGVDVERVRDFEVEGVMAQHFTPAERNAMLTSRGGPLESFFAIWARKEACAKALGVGLLESLACFDVAHVAGRFTPVRTAAGSLDAQGLCVMDLPDIPGLRGALAVVTGPD
jgi:4'-phosphopantetheinyl transferase